MVAITCLALLVGAARVPVSVSTPVVAVKDIVNNVAWWPPSNLQFEEAVGVVSRGVMFATGAVRRLPPFVCLDAHALPASPCWSCLELGQHSNCAYH